MQRIHITYLSNIFSGKRVPSMQVYRKIAAGLGMTMDELLAGIDDRVEALTAKRRALQQMHDQRVEREDRQDLNKASRGQIPLPRLPGLRAVA
jgi:transcriptional regulator with XRE-family HTH domain